VENSTMTGQWISTSMRLRETIVFVF